MQTSIINAKTLTTTTKAIISGIIGDAVMKRIDFD